ncbi:MAG TPA: serine hydrolase domain-containing protein [Gemmatimonas sp.]|uniref:serine hydrolase domain-containing protein n=1 Tax=Gemmatimonas sp. TaxID=1962908 RepID=UPI002ED7FE7A
MLESIPAWMDLAGVPGLAMAVVEHDRVAWSANFGVTNSSTRAPVTDDSLFEAASMSKAVFAYAVLQLVQAGTLSLDRPLVEYHRPAYLPNDARIDRITVRHVLSHTSGLPNWGDDGKPDTLKPAFDPGTRFRYSGEGIFWLQLVVERITRQGLDAFVRTTLFDPAGMRNSAFTLDESMVSRLVHGHSDGRPDNGHGTRGVLSMIAPRATTWGIPLRAWRHEEWLRAAAELDPGNPARRVRFANAASSMLTTAQDYARFLQIVASRTSSQPWMLRDRERDAMLTPIMPVRPGSALAWGLGWNVERQGEVDRCGHEGNNNGRFTAYSGIERSSDCGSGRALVILANAAGGFAVYQRIVRAVTGSDQLSFLASL